MTTALTRIAQATGYDQNQVQLVKDTIARGASDDELMLFLHLAQRSGLDPFSRQIYLIERRAQVDGRWVTTRQPQTAIDGLRLIADRTDHYAPGREPTFVYDADGRLVKATAYVKKFVRGEWHEVAASAHYSEYVQTTRDGAVTKMWAEKPHIMLAKCAEALAIRRAFPAELGGLYTSDETGQAEVTEAPHVTVTQPLPPAPRANPVTGEVIEEAGASYVPPPEPPAPSRRDKMLARIATLTQEADQLDLEITLLKPLDAMTEAELLDHGTRLRAAIDEAKAKAAPAVTQVAKMEEVDLPPVTDAERAAVAA